MKLKKKWIDYHVKNVKPLFWPTVIVNYELHTALQMEIKPAGTNR